MERLSPLCEKAPVSTHMNGLSRPRPRPCTVSPPWGSRTSYENFLLPMNCIPMAVQPTSRTFFLPKLGLCPHETLARLPLPQFLVPPSASCLYARDSSRDLLCQWNLQYLSFCDRLTSLSTTSSRPIRVVAGVAPPAFEVERQILHVCRDHLLCDHPSIHRWTLGCVYPSAAVNRAL